VVDAMVERVVMLETPGVMLSCRRVRSLRPLPVAATRHGLSPEVPAVAILLAAVDVAVAATVAAAAAVVVVVVA